MSTGGSTSVAAVERHPISLRRLLLQRSGVLDDVSLAMMTYPGSGDTWARYHGQAPETGSLHQQETRLRDCSGAGTVAAGCAHEVIQGSPVHTDRLGPWLAAAYRVAVTGLSRSPLSRSEVTASATFAGGAV
ncbi:MAG: hypothetical protein ACRDRG_15455 [Pseudonocardiaceae bacterium]